MCGRERGGGCRERDINAGWRSAERKRERREKRKSVREDKFARGIRGGEINLREGERGEGDKWSEEDFV